MAETNKGIFPKVPQKIITEAELYSINFPLAVLQILHHWRVRPKQQSGMKSIKCCFVEAQSNILLH